MKYHIRCTMKATCAQQAPRFVRYCLMSPGGFISGEGCICHGNSYVHTHAHTSHMYTCTLAHAMQTHTMDTQTQMFAVHTQARQHAPKIPTCMATMYTGIRRYDQLAVWYNVVSSALFEQLWVPQHHWIVGTSTVDVIDSASQSNRTISYIDTHPLMYIEQSHPPLGKLPYQLAKFYHFYST